MGIKDNIEYLKKSIPDDVMLLAVSKTKPLEYLEEAYQCGMRDFGENKVQELVEKYENFHKDVRWHLIGHLQTNKVKYLVDRVFLIHSLDSVNLLNQIEKVFGKAGKTADTLIQINIGREESKTGILEEDLEKEDFMATFKTIFSYIMKVFKVLLNIVRIYILDMKP